MTIQGAPDPDLEVDSSGRVQTLTGLTATDGTNPLAEGQVVNSDRIVVNDIKNTTPGTILIAASEGSTSGHSNIQFNAAFDHVFIHNASAKDLYVNGIEVFNTTTPPTITNQALDGMENWGYDLKTNADSSLIDIDNSNAAHNNITLLGSFLDPGGITHVHEAGGDIFSAGAVAAITTRLAQFTADHGTVGVAGAPIFFNIVVGDGSLPVGFQNVFGQTALT